MPDSIVVGKLVDGNGDPLGNTEIRLDVGGGRNFSMMIHGSTRADGSFRINHVPSGTYYSISGSIPQEFHSINSKVDVGPGERIDFGTVKLGAKEGNEFTRTKLSGETKPNSESEPKSGKQSEPGEKELVLTGKVVDTDGQPVAGAKVYVKDHQVQSAADGTFELTVPEESVQQKRGMPMLVALKDGFGRGFSSIKKDTSSGHELVLPKDTLPIEGTLIDPEGNPIANAKIKVEYISAVEDIEAYLEEARKPSASYYSLLNKRTNFLDDRMEPVTPDSKGRFKLGGIGENRIVGLRIAGDTIRLANPIVVTAKTKPISLRAHSGMMFGQLDMKTIHGHKPNIVCGPTQVINGIVVDSETGQPLRNVEIATDRFADVDIGNSRNLRTKTDENGRFQLLGMPVGEGNAITAQPASVGDDAIPYLPTDFEVPNPDRPGPVDITVKLQRGVFVRGTITDKATGEPVPGARVTYKPYNDNALAQKIYPESLPMAIDDWLTGADGKFQFVALPGKAIVGFWVVRESHYPAGQGWAEIPEERKSADGSIQAYGFPFNKQHPTAMKQLYVDTTEDINDFNIVLDPGRNIAVKMVDPDGQPITNVRVEQARSNVDGGYMVKQSEFEASGFLEGQKRTLVFDHKQSNLGAIRTVGFENTEPITVKLQPKSKITGRLVDGNNDPLAGQVRIDLENNESFFLQSLGTYTTDEDGRFELDAPPGEYTAHVETTEEFYQLTRKTFKVRVNQPFDFGTVDVVERTRQILAAVRAERAAKKAKEQEQKEKDAKQTPNSDRPVNHSISGTVVSAEGRPIAGATIEVDEIIQPEDTAEYLRAAARPEMTVASLPSSKSIKGDSISPVTSDANGKFTIDGIAPGHIAALKIRGDDFALTWTRIANAESKRLTILRRPGMFSDQYGKITIYGNNNPTVVCEATQVISGTLVDRETGAPLPDVEIYSDRFANLPFSEVRDLKTVTDDEGRFRLSGMPAGHTNGISAIPLVNGKSKLYVARDFAVEPHSGAKSVDVRFKLQRGILVKGKVVDKVTGKPIANAEVNYKPYRSNPLASKLYSEDWIPSPLEKRRTAEDGTFRLVALPGKSLVDVLTDDDSPYPSGQGWSEIPGVEKNPSGSIFVFGRFANALHPTAMKEIAVDETNHAAIDITFELDPGKKVPVNLVDQDGQPIVGAEMLYGHSSYRLDRREVVGNQVELSFAKGQQRTVAFYHKQRNLGAIHTIGFADESVTVQLMPNTTVTGKMVNAGGDPIVNALLRFDMVNRNGTVQSLPFKAYTNSKGEFKQLALPGNYKLQAEAPPADFFLIDYDLKVHSNTPINMGTFDPKKRTEEEFEKLNMRTVASKGREWNNVEPIVDGIEFKGIVVDLYGKPVAGATVRRGEIEATTGDDGSFSIKIPKTEVDKSANGQPYIEIEKVGYGPNFAQISSSVADQTILLPNDDHPIEGQLIDPEGNPVAGAAVTVDQYRRFAAGVLENRLKNAVENNQPVERLPQGTGGTLRKVKPVITDANGKFTIRGIGSGRIAYLKITGEKTALRKAIVGTTNQPAVQFENARANFLSDGVIHGRKPVLTCEPSQPIEGIVIDRDTKKPLAGFNVTSFGFLNDGPSQFVGQTDLKTKTDENGRFVLHGMPKGKGNSIIATAPTKGKFAQPFITQVADVPDARGLDPIKMEVGMQRGVWISGKVIDQDTGVGIVDVGVQYMPLDDNQEALKLDRLNQHLILDMYGCRTDKEGRYRFVGVPGPAILAPWVLYGSNYPAGQGYEAVEEILKPARQLGAAGSARPVVNRRHTKTLMFQLRAMKI